MNLKTYIKNYKFNSLEKVVIGEAELIGLILQKEYVGPVYFYSCYDVFNNIFDTFTKYRVLIPESEDSFFELQELVDIKSSDEDSHHYRWLHNNCDVLRDVKGLDMRAIKDDDSI